MNILHLSNTPLSNAPENIASCQRHAGHHSEVLLDRKSNLNKVFVGGTLWHDIDQWSLQKRFVEADIIHFHNFTWSQQIMIRNPELRRIARTKDCIVQFHSPRKSIENFEDMINDPFFEGRRAVIAQYHVRQYPECEHIVPNCLPLHEDRFRFVPMGKWNNDILIASSSPSNVDRAEWDFKGADIISSILRRFSGDSRIQTQMITNTPYQECLTKKAWSHIGIEEFFTGSYHLSFLEYMAMGCATIGYLDELTCQALSKVVGVDAVLKLPYYSCRTDSELYRLISSMKENKDRTKERGEQARAWMHEHLAPNKVSAYYDSVYAKL